MRHGMRRSLLVTATAAITMVLLAMLVPMAILVRSFALEDRLSHAALEVQAVETVVAGRGDQGRVASYVADLNRRSERTRTTVLYPDGLAIGPDAGEDARVVEARKTGRARLDDVKGGAQILVPVYRGASSGRPAQTPVIRVVVAEPGINSVVGVAWGLLGLLGIALLVGSLVVVDRLGQSFVQPIRRLAEQTQELGLGGQAAAGHLRVEELSHGPTEVRELSEAVRRMVERIELLLKRERESVSDLSHRLRTPMTALRLRVEGVTDPSLRGQLGADLDGLQATVDDIVREARRSEREGLDPRTDAVAVLAGRIEHWRPLAEDLGRGYVVNLAETGPLVRTSGADLEAVVDILLDNAFTHTGDTDAITVTVSAAEHHVVLVVEDAGPGFPREMVAVVRGTSRRGSTGLGLSIAQRSAQESGGTFEIGRSEMGGARVAVSFGTA